MNKYNGLGRRVFRTHVGWRVVLIETVVGLLA